MGNGLQLTRSPLRVAAAACGVAFVLFLATAAFVPPPADARAGGSSSSRSSSSSSSRSSSSSSRSSSSSSRSYSSSSSNWGSRRSYGGSSYNDNDGGGSPSILFYILFFVGIPALCLWFWSKGGRAGGGGGPVGSIGFADSLDSQVRGRLGSDDPKRDVAANDFVKRNYSKVQRAWSKRDFGVVSSWAAPDLVAEYQGKLDAMKARGEINIIDRIKLVTVRAIDASSDERVWVYIRGTMVDYTYNEKTQDLISGSQTEEAIFAEFWCLVPDADEEFLLERISPLEDGVPEKVRQAVAA